MIGRRVVTLALLALAVVGLAFGAARLLERDQQELREHFVTDRRTQLKAAVQQIEAALGEVHQDLAFTGRVIAERPDQRQRALDDLVTRSRRYLRAALYGGPAPLVATSPAARGAVRAGQLDPDLAATASILRGRPPGAVEASVRLRTAPGSTYRVFAVALPGNAAVALLLETRGLLSGIEAVTANPDTRLVLLGAGREALEPSDAEVARRLALPPTSGRLARLVDDLVKHQPGTVWLDEKDAARLGLAPLRHLATYAPIRFEGGKPWSLAVLSSEGILRKQERSLALRLGVVALIFAAAMVGFALYALHAGRRIARLQDRSNHLARVAHVLEVTEKVLDSIPSGVLVLGEDGRVTTVNRCLRDRLPGAVGRPLDRAFPDAAPPLAAKLRGLVEEARSTKRVQTLLETALFGPEGRYLISAVPLEQGFPEARALVVVDDTSELAAVQAQLLHAEKLTTVGHLAAGIAHEIGTPLAVIRSRAELLAEQREEGHPDRKSLGIIMDQVDAVSRTIRQLLDFSRVAPAAVQSVALHEIAAHVIEMLRFEAESRKVALGAEVPADLPPVAADPDQLRQALVNLAVNACAACGEGGHVTLRARAGKDASTVTIEVADDGCGIPEADRHRVFDPFFTTKKRGQGTGLGLAIVSQIVRSHGAAIELDSAPGRGTTVRLSWPAGRKQEGHAA